MVATKKGTTKKEFTFKYIIPDHIQDCYVNGAFGGVTPRNEISMHLFCERHPIPKNIKHKIKADGTLSDEISTEIGGDVVRIIQSSVIMDEGTAIAIRDWLSDRIKFLESLRHKDKKGSKEQIQKTGKKK
jgi:hypothetical protein